MNCEYTIIYIWRENVLEYFTLNIFCLSELSVFLELPPRRYRQILFLLFSPLMISQTSNQLDHLKLEKKHKKAVARDDEYAKVNVERTTPGVVSILSYPHHARLTLLRRSPRALNRI